MARSNRIFDLNNPDTRTIRVQILWRGLPARMDLVFCSFLRTVCCDLRPMLIYALLHVSRVEFRPKKKGLLGCIPLSCDPRRGQPPRSGRFPLRYGTVVQ